VIKDKILENRTVNSTGTADIKIEDFLILLTALNSKLWVMTLEWTVMFGSIICSGITSEVYGMVLAYIVRKNKIPSIHIFHSPTNALYTQQCIYWWVNNMDFRMHGATIKTSLYLCCPLTNKCTIQQFQNARCNNKNSLYPFEKTCLLTKFLSAAATEIANVVV
jgi:hypothetical protein